MPMSHLSTTEKVALCLVGVALVWLVTMLALLFAAQEQCNEHGWKKATVNWNLSMYCHRQEAAYDIVIPLSEL